MPAKRYLVTPGPTPVPPEVLAATAAPMIHHRAPDFRATLERVVDRLGQVFRTENDIVLLTSAGTGAMESVFQNVCSAGDRVLVVSHGFFGERFAAMAETYGCDLVHLRYAWGESPNADEVGEKLEEAGGVKVVFLTHSDTSTGVVSDVRSIAERLSGSGALIVVDAISSLAAVPLETDAWGLDVVITSSHKALMSPPGLAFIAVSEAAFEASRSAGLPRYYFDWERARAAQEKGENPFSPAISLFLGVDVALGMILEEGLEAAFERHVRLGRACRAGVKAMGLELFSPDEDRSAVVTAIRMPEGIDGGSVVLSMRERSGVTIIGGQGELRGKIVRIGHIGYINVFDVTTALSALELALAEVGAEIERSTAVTAALEAYAEPVSV
ncbi:MAG: alanine--glyoxylate aminotransferase family protein [Gaiellaceae bacterium]